MSQEKIDRNAEDRREAADFLYSEAVNIIEKIQNLTERSTNESGGERERLRQEAERLANLAQTRLGLGNTAPSEDTLEEVRVLIESAKAYIDKLQSTAPS